MINKENEIFKAVSNALRDKYGSKNIYIIGNDISDKPPKFPAISIIQTNNNVNKKYSTFNQVENVAKEKYKIEIFSNLETKKSEQIRDIAEEVNRAMERLGYIRTFYEPIFNSDPTIVRKVARYENNIVI